MMRKSNNNLGSSKKSKAAIYMRVSTDKQVQEGTSLNTQNDKMIEVVKNAGYSIEDILMFKDEGISGSGTKHRDGFNDMMKAIKNGDICAVYVLEFSRLFRNSDHALRFALDLREAKVDLYEGIDANILLEAGSTSSAKKFMEMIQYLFKGMASEEELVKIKERTRNGLHKNFELTACHGGAQLLGYKIMNDPDIPNVNKFVVEKEAVIVREIFTLYSKGLSINTICERLNNKGYKTKQGKKFYANAINTIISNVAYKGYAQFGKIIGRTRRDVDEPSWGVINEDASIVKSNHEAIVSEELWDKCQKLRGTKPKYKKVVDHVHLLTGMLKCPHCGRNMTITSVRGVGKKQDKKYFSYICDYNKAHRHINQELCPQGFRMSKPVLDKLVLKTIVNVLNGDKLATELKEHLEENTYSGTTSEAKIIELKTNIRTQESNFKKMIESSIQRNTELNMMMLEAIQNQIDVTKAELQVLENADETKSEISKDKVRMFVNKFIDQIDRFEELNNYDIQQKVKDVLELFVKEVSVIQGANDKIKLILEFREDTLKDFSSVLNIKSNSVFTFEHPKKKDNEASVEVIFK